MKMNFTIPVFALLSGVALGFWSGATMGASAARETETENSSAEVAKKNSRKNRVVSDAPDATENALRARLLAVEEELARMKKIAKNEASEKEKFAKKIEDEVFVATNRPRQFSYRENLEKMKRENPERYARWQEGMREFRARRADESRARVEFFANFDTSFMAENEKKNHREIQALFAKCEELERQNVEELSDEERGKYFAERSALAKECHQRLADERRALLRQTARTIGFNENDTTDFIGMMDDIFDATNPFGFRHARDTNRSRKARE